MSYKISEKNPGSLETQSF